MKGVMGVHVISRTKGNIYSEGEKKRKTTEEDEEEYFTHGACLWSQ